MEMIARRGLDETRQRRVGKLRTFGEPMTQREGSSPEIRESRIVQLGENPVHELRSINFRTRWNDDANAWKVIMDFCIAACSCQFCLTNDKTGGAARDWRGSKHSGGNDLSSRDRPVSGII